MKHASSGCFSVLSDVMSKVISGEEGALRVLELQWRLEERDVAR